MAIFSTEAEVSEWIESVDEQNTQTSDIREELESAWLVVFGHPLSDEDADTQRDAWSHLCAACM
jgi:hypothetical protein